MSLRSKKNITICRAIPAFVPRKLALNVLHDHNEIITLNPLVLSHRQIVPPRDAPSDEAHSIWYEITERIQFIPGLGKAGSSTISFNGVFHNVPWGLQTHIYAPMSVDMRVQYRIAGSQPGVEAAAPLELGLEQLGAPKEGLYLRADIQFKCNVALASFVKSTSIAAIGEMVGRMVKKAEELDADVLQNMIKEERSGNLSRIQSRESATSQGQMQNIAQVQTYPQTGDRPPPGWPLGQRRTEPQELDSPDVYAYRKLGQQYQQEAQHQQYPNGQPGTVGQQYRGELQQRSYPDGKPGKVSHAIPVVIAELDGGYSSATAEHGNWSQPNVHNDNYSYPRARSRSPAGEDRRRYHDQSSNGSHPQYAQNEPHSVQPLFSGQQSHQPPYETPITFAYQQQNGQHEKQHSYQQHQYHQQESEVPQFQSERKYSFDENRLQPEVLNNGTDGRRWSAQYARA